MRLTFERKGRDISDMDFCVVGFRGDTPSNAAAIHLSNNAQDELFGYPFTNGIAPNWVAWSTAEDPDAAKFQQVSNLWPKRPGPMHKTHDDASAESYRDAVGWCRRTGGCREPQDKPWTQLIRTESPGVQAGVWRKFLGVTPGHTYRVSALLNTLQMDSAEGDWSFSVHAAYNSPQRLAYNSPERTDLTVEQLSGLAQLPDGSKGPTAGQIACFNPGLSTKGKWELCSTDEGTPSPGKTITDIRLPSGVDTLTVWVRHSASQSTGVGILWVKLEDLSIMQDKPRK